MRNKNLKAEWCGTHLADVTLSEKARNTLLRVCFFPVRKVKNGGFSGYLHQTRQKMMFASCVLMHKIKSTHIRIQLKKDYIS
jgi:hypothetical protein